MRKFILYTTLIFIHCSLYAQQTIKISGFVQDKTSREVLIGATIVDTIQNKGTVTDNNGYFSIWLTSPAIIKVSYVGYESALISIEENRDTVINIELIPGKKLDEVTIVAQQHANINIASLSTKELSQIPSLGGKPDIGKSLQMLPGISTQNEGSSYLLVRGGDPGQNLYLFDNVPVIHVNHLGGFMSVFNPDIINDINVYKGGFPAKYGGKLSSIVDIIQKEGNSSYTKGSFSIGVTDASFSMEGPVKFMNANYIVAGRKTLIDPLMAITSAALPGNEFVLAYGFHDINGKITWKPNLRNKINLNLYYGDDYINYWADKMDGNHHFANTWGNWLVSGHWKSVLSSRSYLSNSISFTRYRLQDMTKYSIEDRDGSKTISQKNLSSINEFSLRSNVKYQLQKSWTAELGLQSSIIYYLPSYSSNTSPRKKYLNTLENAVFLNNHFSPLNIVHVDAGIRLVQYCFNGYPDFSLEPRFTMNVDITTNHTITFSSMAVNQHSHLLITPGNIASNEVWVPSGKQILPSSSTQYSVGWKGEYKQRKYISEVNAFYKELQNLSTYKEGYTHLYGDNNWKSKIESNGNGIAKGIEFLLKKNTGKLTGFAGYTLSKTTRKYPGINNGNKYLFDFDRLHSFSFASNYHLMDNISFNISWIYQTGLPYTPAIGRQYVPAYENGGLHHYEILFYGESNSKRMKDYHRLDIGVSYIKYTKKRNRKAIWNLSVYNAYNRKNPYYYYYNSNNTSEIYNPRIWDRFETLKLYQISFFPIIPSISYKLYFDSKNDKPKQKNENTFKDWLYFK